MTLKQITAQAESVSVALKTSDKQKLQLDEWMFMFIITVFIQLGLSGYIRYVYSTWLNYFYFFLLFKI